MPPKPAAGHIRCANCAYFVTPHLGAGLCQLATTTALPAWVDPVSKIANIVAATDGCDFGRPKPSTEYVL